ncbi:MAG: 30S ribosomal protein S24e [Candidatus Micrarchaeota archaeon]|nr:30S ribosomal protein S24e [Candidatus Micrarchaeota archaeon]
MELHVTSETTNNLLKRKEIKFSISEDNATVSKAEIHRELCKKLNISPESTIIVSVNQAFGARQSAGIAHSYHSKEEMEKTEPKHVLNRFIGKKGEAQPAKDEKKEEKKEEKAEEKK